MSTPITLYFLQASRAIRTAWILEELGVSYEVDFSERNENGLGYPDFKKRMGTKLGKSPTIKDGDLVIQESIVIADYLCEQYDKENRLVPASGLQRIRVKEWMIASEATFLMQSLPILYVKRAFPGPENDHINATADKKIGGAVKGALDWLEEELAKGNGKYLVGNTVTAADIMVHFSIQFILARNMGTSGGDWPKIEQWVKSLEQEEAYKRAVKKTGYKL